MKAWRVEAHASPASRALKQVDIPKPTPAQGEVLVKVEACGLNHLDVWVCKGVEGHKFPLPLIPGCDIAGIVEGKPVLINPGVSCGSCRACLSGFEPLCPSYGIIGETRNGGLAEYVAVPAANVIPRPAGMSATDAASIQIPFITAWSMLTRKTQLQAGETALIQAGGSGVSVAAIQIAKHLGARVITTVGSDAKAAKARALGADHVINYRTQNFRDEVKKITGKKGCEVVIDHVGADTFSESLKCLAWGGRLATCGATTGAKVEIDLKPIFFKNISIFGSTMGSKSDLLEVLALIEQGKLKPVIERVLPMSQAPQAMDLLEKHQVFGKVVLTA